MFVPYMTINDKLEVTHSLRDAEHPDIYVYFEEPDPVYFFKSATIDLDKMLIEQREGFDDAQMSRLVDFCRDNKALINEVEPYGGINHAKFV